MSTPNRSRSAAESLPSSVAPTFTTAAGPTVGEFVQPPDLNPNAEERRDALPEPEPNRLVGKLRAMSILYVIGIHLFLAVVLAKSDFLPKLRAKLFPRPAGEISDHFRRMSHYHAWMDGHIPDGSVFFIGDSITQALCVSSVAPNAVNLGIGGDTTWGLLNRIPSLPSLQRASLTVIAMGVNDLARRDNDEIIHNFRSILALLPAHIPIIISSIFPIEEHFPPYWKGWNDETLWLRPEDRGLVEGAPLRRKGGVLTVRNRGLSGEGQSRTFGAGEHEVRRPQNNIITTSTPKSHA